MSTSEFLSRLRERDVRLLVEDGRLKCDAPPGVLDADLRSELAARKQELLALIVGARAALQAPRSLVPLKPTGSYPPLFARPGHNGDVFCYRALVPYLDAQQPLYGVEPRGLDGSPTADTVEEMAAYEVEQIRGFQAKGPYYIAGFCAGGTVAFESARQLVQAGEEVARVVLFGSPFPTAYRTAAQMSLRLRSLGDRVRRHAYALSAGSVADGLEYIRSRSRAREADRSIETVRRQDPALANRLRIEETTIAAVKRYEPGPYAGRVDVFLPNEASRHSGDRPEEWRRVVSEVVEHVGPDECNGDNMLREPNIRAIAALLNSSLRDQGGRHVAG
jgi:thioesterase domain-containing protein